MDRNVLKVVALAAFHLACNVILLLAVSIMLFISVSAEAGGSRTNATTVGSSNIRPVIGGK